MANNRLKQKRSANKLRFSTQVFVVGTILSITFFLLFVDSLKTYTSTMTITVGTKSQAAAAKKEQLISDALRFPRMLAFYDRLLKYNPDVRDVAKGQSPDQRKKAWNDIVSVERAGKNSSAIKVSITAQRESDADQLVKKTTRTLFDVLAVYYNIKDDFDLRITDGPVSSSNITGWYWTMPLSVLLGFMIAFFLQGFLSRGKQALVGRNAYPETKASFDFKKADGVRPGKKIESLEELYMAEQVQSPYAAWGMKDKRSFPQNESAGKNNNAVREMKKLTKEIEPDKYPNFSEVAKADPSRAGDRFSQQTNGGAPGNLPVADESFFVQGLVDDRTVQNRPETEPAAEEEKMEEKKSPRMRHEPTQQELKERLNKLLRGEL